MSCAHPAGLGLATALLCCIASSAASAQSAPAPRGEEAGEVVRFEDAAAFRAARAPASAQFVTLSRVVANGPHCPLTFVRDGDASAEAPGTIVHAGARWRPLYSTSPVRACEFGAVGDARYPLAGGTFAGAANGTKKITTTRIAGVRPGMRVTIANPDSNAGLAPPATTRIESIETNAGVMLTASAPACATCEYVAWSPIDATSVTGTDDQPAIQAAIDFALRHGFADVKLSEGIFKIAADTLQLGYGDTFRTVRLIGGERDSLAGLPGVTLVCILTDRPCVNVQGGRTILLKGLNIVGPGLNYASHGQWYNNALSPNQKDWLAPDLVRTGASPGGLQTHTPLVGIALDAFSGVAPAAPYVQSYPAWTKLAGQYGRLFTSGLTLSDVHVGGFAVNIALGLNTALQGDYFRAIGGGSQSAPLLLLVANHQSRNVRVQDWMFAGYHTAMSNSQYGMGTGEWNGPLENLSGGGGYQFFDFGAMGYSGPLTITNIYAENQVRIGNFRAGGSYGNKVHFIGGLINLSEAMHGQIPASYMSATGVSVEFNGTGFNTARRVGALSEGPGAFPLTLKDVTFASILRDPGGPALQAAMNFSGGVLVGNSKYNTLQTDMTVASNVNATYFPGPSGPFASQDMGDDVKFLLGRQRVRRQHVNQFASAFADTQNRRWRMTRPQPPIVTMRAGAGFATSEPAFSGDTMRFTMSGGAYSGGFSRLAPGWLIYHPGTGTIFLVSDVGAPDAAGNRPVTTIQQNNLKVDPKTGAFVASTLADVALSGYVMLIQTNLTLPQQVAYGDFTAGSTAVANVSRGDGRAGDLASWLAPGDILLPLTFDEASLNWPIGGANAIASVTNGAPGGVTLERPATRSGRTPIYPLPIH